MDPGPSSQGPSIQPANVPWEMIRPVVHQQLELGGPAAASASGQEPPAPNASLATLLSRFDAFTRDLHAVAAGELTGVTSTSTSEGADLESGLQEANEAIVQPSESLAASAERQRWSGELGASDNMISAATHWVDELLPYLLVLLAIFVIQHATGLLQLAWLLACLIKVNKVIRTAWLTKDSYLHQALADLSYQVFSLLACMYLTNGWALLSGLGFNIQSAPHTTIVSTLVSVAVLDSIARLLVALSKLPLLLGCKLLWASAGSKPNGSGPAIARERMKREAALMSLIDNASTCYRHLLPVPFWFTFLLHNVSTNAIVSSCLAGGYVTRKAWELAGAARMLVAAAKKLMSAAMLSYGRPATLEEVQAAGNQCPVCQDGVKCGVRLSCGHVYCEECIAEWLERDSTCPMCRKQVRPPGSTTASTLASLSPLPRLF